MSSITIEETDATGQTIALYSVSPNVSEENEKKTARTKQDHSRIDLIPTDPRPSSRHESPRYTTVSAIFIGLLTPFLPVGYPHTVRPDYTSYQIYDSIQAFASTIAGLLASRAVLLSLNLASATSDSDAAAATKIATAATILSIAQESIGRFATILFAHRFARRIEAEVKFYRFFADITNDIAFLLDCLSPSLTVWWRVPALCLASACRSICGVAGGSSKAILSSHFACAGNIGELNAKDSSQETVVNLMGMWAGGLVVSRVHGATATWVWMISLLAIHLWANYMAVRSVNLTTLNRSRARILVNAWRKSKTVPLVEEVNRKEHIIGVSQLMGLDRQSPECRVGVTFEELLSSMALVNMPISGSFRDPENALTQLVDIFGKENFLFWQNRATNQGSAILKEGADERDQLKIWYLAAEITKPQDLAEHINDHSQGTFSELREALNRVNSVWDTLCTKMDDSGWSIAGSNLEIGLEKRIRVNTRETSS